MRPWKGTICKRVLALLPLLWLAVSTPCDRPAQSVSTPVATGMPSAPATAERPAPTLTADARIEQAHLALRDGDYEAAIALFHEALLVSGQQVRAELLLPLARAYFAAGQYHDVVALWSASNLVVLSMGDRAVALGLLGRSHEALDQWEEAISAYERHLALDDAAAYPIRQRMAEAYEALAKPAQAVQQLEAVDLDELDTSGKATVLEQLAELHRQLGDHQAALSAYDQILSFAKPAYYRAVTLLRKGQLLLELGRTQEGADVLHRAVREYPQTWGAYAALLALDELDAAQVSLLLRGQVLFHAGQFDQSITILEKYRLANPYGFHSTAHLYAGMDYAALGRHEEAIEQFDVVMRDFGWTQAAGDAWMAKAGAVAAAGGDASEVYSEFARLYPAHARAPEALWRAAVSLERGGDWERAAELYGALRRAYPDDSGAEEAAFREALAAYVLGDDDRAGELWERDLEDMGPVTALEGQTSATERARLLTWLGLTNARAGNADLAKAYWGQAARLAADDYYGLRARDLMEGNSLLLPLGVTSGVRRFDISEDDWQRIRSWVQSWTEQDHTEEGPTKDHSSLRRAWALWQLGWYDDAMSAYRQLRDTMASDAHALLALAEHCYANEVWAMLISCAERLIAQGSSRGAVQSPNALWRLAYPTAYGRLVSAEASLYGVDPLLFLALIRQESQFSPHVSSWAGAVGLAQVMPQTGAWIAEKIGPEGFEEALLLRPMVSVRYGMWYLAQALELFDGNWPAALAAYNAGWTNVRRWTGEQAIHDPDLFYETIALSETKAFVQLVYENYRAYQRIYQP